MLTTIKKMKINESEPTEKTKMILEYNKLPRGVAQFSNASSNLFTLNDILLINVLYLLKMTIKYIQSDKVYICMSNTHPLYQLT